MEIKICETCGFEGNLFLFPREIRNKKWYYLPHCKNCSKKKKKNSRIKYRENNKEKLKLRNKKWYQNNRLKIIQKTSDYKKNNRNKYNENYKIKKQNDPSFRIRENVRSSIKQALKKNKNGLSISKYLLYTMQELKKHLENLFEPWMTWNNYGRYNSKTWDDTDQSTWTWQIDHIIPQSKFIYTSMDDQSFKDCWALNNLRPYSSKLNSIEGANRKRHFIKGNI